MRVESYNLKTNAFLTNAKKPEFTFLKKLSTLVILILAPTLFAQASYEIDVRYGFGASELAFNSVPGIAVSIYPIKNFGVSFGVEYSWRWCAETREQKGEYSTIDSEDNSLFFNYEIEKYKEKLYGQILQIPILLKYSNDLYYAAAGLKIGMPQNAKADISYEGLKTWGYYPKSNLTLTEPLSQGFGKHDSGSHKAKISSLETTIMLALEGGVKLKLSDNFSLAAGVFADYSFNKGFNRPSLPLIERTQVKYDSASLAVNDRWKSWRPWSVGVVVKLSFGFEPEKEHEQIIDVTEPEPAKEIVDTNHRIAVKAETPPPPVPVSPPPPPPPSPLPSDTFSIPQLPDFLLNREADFVFNYPETRTSPSDSVHLALVSQIADTLRARPNSQLHCVGYSEKLLSEAVAYETAYQRAFRIRYTLSTFYGIMENRIFIYSQGSRNSGYRRAECFVN